MKVMLRGRQAGKTTEALHWVSKGVPIAGYPGWTRVLLVHDIKTEVAMRQWPHPNGGTWWSNIEDWSHRIYSYDDWRNARGTSPTTQVRIDNLDLLMERLLGYLPGRLTGFTMTGEVWEPERPTYEAGPTKEPGSPPRRRSML